MKLLFGQLKLAILPFKANNNRITPNFSPKQNLIRVGHGISQREQRACIRSEPFERDRMRYRIEAVAEVTPVVALSEQRICR